jgi:hypothetical protein
MQALVPQSEDEKDMNIAKKAYIDECTGNLQNVLPTLLRIKDQKLMLHSYAFTLGLCSGFKIALHSFSVMLRKISLCKNNLTDKGFSLICSGLA